MSDLSQMYKAGLLALVLAITVGLGVLLLQQTVFADDDVGENSCDQGCLDNTGSVGDNSCNGSGACVGNTGKIGNNACNGFKACFSNTENIKPGRCNSNEECSGP